MSAPLRPSKAGDHVHANNFNLLRLLAASSVIVSHAYGLGHPLGYYDQTTILNPDGIGWAAVNLFFLVSGYLIMKAASRHPPVLDFARNRALRIIPGLIVCVVITTVGLGLFASSVPFGEFMRQSETLKFLGGNSTGLLIEYFLPGVFTQNIFGAAVNGSLWTLPYEIGCYAIVAVLMLAGVMRRGRWMLIALVLVVLFYAEGALFIRPGQPHYNVLSQSHRLVPCFALGMLYANFDDRVPIRWWMVAAAVAAFALCVVAGPLAGLLPLTATLALAAFTFWFAFLQSPGLARFRGLPDYSYGIYIYAFPIQQIVVGQFPGLPPLLHSAICFLIVLVPAGLSWHFIEKPALRLKRFSLLKSGWRLGARRIPAA